MDYSGERPVRTVDFHLLDDDTRGGYEFVTVGVTMAVALCEDRIDEQQARIQWQRDMYARLMCAYITLKTHRKTLKTLRKAREWAERRKRKKEQRESQRAKKKRTKEEERKEEEEEQ